MRMHEEHRNNHDFNMKKGTHGVNETRRKMNERIDPDDRKRISERDHVRKY